jgi:SAM-dependent methyltransferase
MQDRRVPTQPTFEELIAEGDAVPVEGWDFSWFEGRATEERPAWGYARLLSERIAGAAALLDIQTGGGEVLAGAVRSARAATGTDSPPVLAPPVLAPPVLAPPVLAPPVLAASVLAAPVLAATESWPPNLALARRALGPLGGAVVGAGDDADLPFGDANFDLVVSRHPTVVLWHEIARVLVPDGSYLSQQIGPGTNRELFDFMMGRQPVNRTRSPEAVVAAARRAGLEVVDLREQALRVEFFDVAAVVHFLKKVLWTVPGFTVAGYVEQLARMHEHIQANGSFISHARRILIEARKPPAVQGAVVAG